MKEKKLPDLIASSAMMRYLPSFAGVKSRKMRIGRKASIMTNHIFLSMPGAFASSVESGEGDASHLVDGSPRTYWHTMYSVTVANYPHWFDLDCGSAKILKGFTYLPRQDSPNGRIKNYRVQVSEDGKSWSKAVAEGNFENGMKQQRVLFGKPVKARYLRFTALSSQDGQDFATCAEFTVLQ